LAATTWRRAFVVSVKNLASKLPDSYVQSLAIITSMIAEKLVLDSSDFELRKIFIKVRNGEVFRRVAEAARRAPKARGRPELIRVHLRMMDDR
jgi:hypothetical protein